MLSYDYLAKVLLLLLSTLKLRTYTGFWFLKMNYLN